MKRKHRRQLKLLVKVLPEILERLERLEAEDSETSKWKDTYGPLLDMDPRAPLSDELQQVDALPYPLWDDDEYRRGVYL